jgi:hypothetical protein
MATRGTLWRCPRCGQTFVSRNLPHSCAVRELDAHFADAAPHVRATFDALLDALRSHGDVIVNATRTRITFQGRMRFAGVQQPRRSHLAARFLLTHPVRHARIRRVDYLPPYFFDHHLRLETPADVDATLRRWLAESWRIGQQEHVGTSRLRKVRRPPPWVHVPQEVRAAMEAGMDPSRARGPIGTSAPGRASGAARVRRRAPERD